MATPYRVAIDASNQPTAAQNYEHGGSALTGFLAPAAGLTDGQRVVLLAEQVNGNGAPAGAFEFIEATWNDSTTDFFSRDTLLRSSSGALIDWSAAGVNAVPRLRVLSELSDAPTDLVSFGAFSTSTASIIVGGDPAFKLGYDYEIRAEGLVATASSFLTALFWNPDTADWDTASAFGTSGYGGYVGTGLVTLTNSTGFAYLHASNAAQAAGGMWSVRMQLYDPANPATFLHGKFETGWLFGSSPARVSASLRGSSNTIRHTGVALVPNTGQFSAGRYWCIGKRRPYQ